MSGFELSPRPPVVAQGKAPHCWAAAMTSWLTLHKDRPQLNRQALVERYGDPSKEGSLGFDSIPYRNLCSDLALYPSNVLRMASRKGIEVRENREIARKNAEAKAKAEIAKRRPPEDIPPISLTEVARLFNEQADRFFESSNELLRLKGYSLLIFAHTRSAVFGTISHMVVVFATQMIGGEPNLIVMDPNRAGAIRPLPLFELLDLPSANLVIKEVMRTKAHKPLVTLLRTEDI